ncbi:hypothetical protein SY27_04030 [Flavobacterium sp. 316]|uniref:hypothetical protein n=1 Tax=Flavobacterium sp. 316 TaxID=1603293 RepID=UPI0005E0578C|nr:hypothetical protein [Flavobacterium sp. 316]KIX21860.1 hypothetical protein SY27_04030 [Flavobacterium sp. 316]
MKEKSLVLLFLLIILFSCKSTYTKIGDKDANYIPYYLKVFEADSLFIVKDYKRSYEILDSLFKKYEPINISGYKEYETYLMASYLVEKNKAKIDKILQKSFQRYGSNYIFFENDTLLNKILKESKFNKNDLSLFSEKYVLSLDLKLRDTVELMVAQDKDVRGKGPVIEENIEKINRQENINKQNENRIITIFNKYGYPSVKKIGYYEYNQKDTELLAVYLHCSPAFMDSILLPKLYESLRKGETPPYNYATVYDKLKIYQTDEQLYGSFLDYQGHSTPLINPKKIDSIRKSVGLNNLNYSKWRLKAKYNYDMNIN